MSKNLVDLECPRCGETQKNAWHSRKVCCSCRTAEEKAITRTPKGMAWAAMNKALRSGLLQRQPCEVCAHPKSDGHHDDYAKPLDVRWLCRSCHKFHHSKFGPGKNALSTQGETP